LITIIFVSKYFKEITIHKGASKTGRDKECGTQITNKNILIPFNFSTIFRMCLVVKTIFHPMVGKRNFINDCLASNCILIKLTHGIIKVVALEYYG
jgi:hypothetical protein